MDSSCLHMAQATFSTNLATITLNIDADKKFSRQQLILQAKGKLSYNLFFPDQPRCRLP